MKKEEIRELLVRFEAAGGIWNGVECWSARELQLLLGCDEWRNFTKVMEKARAACEAAGEAASDHFVGINKMIALAKGAQRSIEDMALTRYACYLIAQNGYPAKPAIAFAQTYFAVQTRKQEVIEQHLLDVARVTAREKPVRSEKKLSGIIYQRGVDHAGFAVIRSKGDEALFGRSTQGALTRSFPTGKRIAYTPPVRLFLLGGRGPGRPWRPTHHLPSPHRREGLLRCCCPPRRSLRHRRWHCPAVSRLGSRP
jgi:hypothetical protein